MQYKKLLTVLFASTLSVNAFATETKKNNDPLEGWNRSVYKMNDNLDRAILKPITKGYVWIMPKIGQKGVHNFLSNLRLIPSFINDVLQANFQMAAADGWRFVINSTVGIAGFGDIATSMGLPERSNDLGLTLARWGYTNSSYFVIPFWGPSTIRDGGALIPYYFMTVYPYIRPQAYTYGLLALDILDKRSQFLGLDEVAKQAALDPYAFQRNAYLQHRDAQIAEVRHEEAKDPLDDADLDDDLDSPVPFKNKQ